VYAAGFSGTARAAFHMGMIAPGAFAGIVAAGGGFPVHEPPTRSITFAVFGTVGVFDFNYDEMHDLEAQLTALAIPNRLEVFDGTHQWPDAELAESALAWMELQAMRAGTRDKNAELVDELWSRDLERARNLAALGQLVDSRNLYVSLLSDFRELRNVTDAERELAGFARDPRLKKEDARIGARRERDQRYLASAGATFERLKSESPVPWAQELISDLEIRSLTRIAKNASDVEEARSARRKLNNDLVFVSFYLPRGFMTRKQYARAIVSLRIAMEIDPEDPELEFQLARCYAGLHDRKRALSHLRSAIARGVDLKGRLTGVGTGTGTCPRLSKLALFDRQVGLDFLHALRVGRKLDGLSLLGVGTDLTREEHDRVARVDVDLEALDERIVEQLSLHVHRDSGVGDDLADAAVRLGRVALAGGRARRDHVDHFDDACGFLGQLQRPILCFHAVGVSRQRDDAVIGRHFDLRRLDDLVRDELCLHFGRDSRVVHSAGHHEHQPQHEGHERPASSKSHYVSPSVDFCPPLIR
jgi:tetratricopeptide (TPR) repeat protein